MTFRQLYRRHFMLAEFVAAGFLFIFLVVWSLLVDRSVVLDHLGGNRLTVYSTTASIGGSLLGFILTAVSVIIVFGEMPRFQLLRRSGQYRTVFAAYFQAIFWLAALTLIAFAGIFADTEARPSLWLPYLVIFFGLVSFVRVCRCVWILKRMTEIAIMPVADAYDEYEGRGVTVGSEEECHSA
jgi:hypothetical protein